MITLYKGTLTPPHSPPPPPCMTVHSSTLMEQVSSYRYKLIIYLMGLLVTNNLSWSSHAHQYNNYMHQNKEIAWLSLQKALYPFTYSDTFHKIVSYALLWSSVGDCILRRGAIPTVKTNWIILSKIELVQSERIEKQAIFEKNWIQRYLCWSYSTFGIYSSHLDHDANNIQQLNAGADIGMEAQRSRARGI